MPSRFNGFFAAASYKIFAANASSSSHILHLSQFVAIRIEDGSWRKIMRQPAAFASSKQACLNALHGSSDCKVLRKMPGSSSAGAE
jgi:hypothetical protein